MQAVFSMSEGKVSMSGEQRQGAEYSGDERLIDGVCAAANEPGNSMRVPAECVLREARS